MTHQPSQDQDLRTALEAERAELHKANDEATTWGGAVGARASRIRAIDSKLAALTPAQAPDRAGERDGLTERESEAPIYEAFARYVGDADERADDFRMFATGYHAAMRCPAAVSSRIDTQIWTAARALSPEQARHPEWLWWDDLTVSFGRWAANGQQAPYIRADIALAPQPTGTEASRGVGGETPDQIFDRLRVEHMVREWCEPLSKGPPGANFVDGLIGVLRLRFKHIDPQYRPTSKAARAAYEAIAEARGITKDWAPANQSKVPRS